MANLLQKTNDAIYAALAADSALQTAIGASGKIQRGFQGAKVTVPGVVYQFEGHQKLLQEVVEPRRVDLLVSCYHSTDMSCSAVAEAAYAVLNDKTTLTSTQSKIFLSDCKQDLGVPVWSEPEKSFRLDFGIEVFIRAD